MKLSVLLCLAAVVAYASAECITDCSVKYSNCIQNAGQDTDDICKCISNLGSCLGSCSNWCDVYGDYYDAWYGPWCSNGGNYCGICKAFDNCDGGNNPGPSPSPSKTPKYYYDLIICYYADATCAFTELLAALISSSNNAVVEFYEDVCDAYENYCEDVTDLNRKRGVASTLRSVKVQFTGFDSQEAADASRNSVVTDSNNGDITLGDSGYVASASEASCNDCSNACGGCALSGKWSTVTDADCVEYNGCPADEGDVNIKVKSTLQFDGSSQDGDNENLFISQKWEFSGSAFGDISTPSIECNVKYGGVYRFYSNAATCSNRIELDESASCTHDCKENIILDSDYKAMLCENFPVTNEIDDITFSDSCKAAEIQDYSYTKGSAGQLVPAVLAVFAAVALLF